MIECQAFSPKARYPLQTTVFSILSYAIIAPNRSWKGSAFSMLPLWSDGSSSQKETRKEDSRSHLALPFCPAKSRQGRRDLVPSQVWQHLQARLPSWSSSSEWDFAERGTEKVTLGNCFPCKDPASPFTLSHETAKHASYLAEGVQPGIEYVTVSTSPLHGVQKTSFSYRRIKRSIRETRITDWYQTIFS